MTSPTNKQYQFVQGDAKLHITRNGPKTDTTICFIPGWGGDHWIWQENFEQCAKTHDSLIIDLPGFGKSQVPLAQVDIEQAAQLIVDALDNANVNHCILVGHSLGGAISLTIAALLQERALAVMAVDSLAFNVIYPATPREAIVEMTAPFKNDFNGAIDGLSAGYFSENTPIAARTQITKDMYNGDANIGIRVLESYLAWDRDKYLKEYQGPIFSVIAQVHEPILDHRITDRIVVNVIDETGHYIMIDQTKALQHHLDSIIAN